MYDTHACDDADDTGRGGRRPGGTGAGGHGGGGPAVPHRHGPGTRTGRLVRRTLTGLALVGLTVACGPTAADGSAAPPPVSTTASASPTPGPTTAEPTTPAPTTAAPTTAAPAATTAAPAPKRTTEAPAAEATCEIVSNAGNCYSAGQFCRKSDLGSSTHAANRRVIRCVMDGDRARWTY